jgi:hypothetical protein
VPPTLDDCADLTALDLSHNHIKEVVIFRVDHYEVTDGLVGWFFVSHRMTWCRSFRSLDFLCFRVSDTKDSDNPHMSAFFSVTFL